MSSLTDEQKKRIEQNRAKALAKLAEKKSLAARTQNQNNTTVTTAPKHFSSSTVNSNSFYTKPHSSGLGSETTLGLARFEYRPSTSKTSSYKATGKAPVSTNVQSQATFNKSQNEAKNVNDTLMKRVVSGTCVLISKARFKVVVGFHAKLIGVLKSIPSKCYGKFPLTRTQACRLFAEKIRLS
jgi:hypothetical protein